MISRQGEKGPEWKYDLLLHMESTFELQPS